MDCATLRGVPSPLTHLLLESGPHEGDDKLHGEASDNVQLCRLGDYFPFCNLAYVNQFSCDILVVSAWKSQVKPRLLLEFQQELIPKYGSSSYTAPMCSLVVISSADSLASELVSPCNT